MLWLHQQEAIEWARGRREVILHLGMGCGKTRVALEIIKEMMIASSISRILVGCPKAVMPAWLKQAQLWLPGIRVLLLTKGSSKDKAEAISAAMATTTPLIVVGNYESLWRIPAIETIRWDVLVWDEVHRLKSPSGAASKWAAKMGKKNPTARRLGLSGTLLSHAPQDAFGVWRAMQSPECQTFGTTWTLFKATWFVAHPHIQGALLGINRHREKEFAAKIAADSFHRRSEDVLDLPPIQFVEVPVEMTPAEAAVYRQLEQDFCAEVDGGYITPANAMEGLLRMLQACNGYMKLDDAAAATQIGDAPSKRAAFADLIADIDRGEPIVVFCRFRTDIDSVIAACRADGRSVSELSGRINDLAEWQAGKTAVLVAQIQSGGIGIDLTRASYGVFYSLGHSLSEWLQAIARLHRPGQTNHTVFYSLVSTLLGKTTADGRVYEALSQRQEVIDAIIGSYRNRQSVERSAH